MFFVSLQIHIINTEDNYSGAGMKPSVRAAFRRSASDFFTVMILCDNYDY